MWNFILWLLTKAFHYITFFGQVTTVDTMHEYLDALFNSSQMYLACNLCSLDQEILGTVIVRKAEVFILFPYISVSLLVFIIIKQMENPVCYVTTVKNHGCDFAIVF
jgi:hypothetical protein